jgi:hypothetical protein
MDARREGSVPAPDFSAVLVLLQGGGEVAKAGPMSTRVPLSYCKAAPTSCHLYGHPGPESTTGPAQDWYDTEVHVAPDAVAGSYTVDPACKLADGTTSKHTDTLTHVVGDETIKTFTWPEPDPIDGTATETAGPPMTTPTYWLTGTAPAPFGTPHFRADHDAHSNATNMPRDHHRHRQRPDATVGLLGLHFTVENK